MAAGRGRPLSLQQFIGTVGLLVLAWGTLAFGYLRPHWLNPHRYLPQPTVRKVLLPVGSIGRAPGDTRVSLQRRKELVVGDSMAADWPGTPDIIAMAGQTTETLTADMRRLLHERAAGHQYERIFLWPGTTQINRDDDVQGYLAALELMVVLALRYTDSVTIITPMPWSPPQRARVFKKNPPWLAEIEVPMDTRPVMREVRVLLRQLERDHAEVRIVDVSQVVEAILAEGTVAQDTADGLHLSPSGFARLLALAG